MYPRRAHGRPRTRIESRPTKPHATGPHTIEPNATEPHTTEPHTTEKERSNPLAEPIVAKAPNKMTELLQQMSKRNRQEERKPEPEEDRALERFLRFHPPMYQGKPDS
jgi:hypothetical protein